VAFALAFAFAAPLRAASASAAEALAQGPRVPALLVLRHGKIYTLDPAQPWAESVAIRGATIIAVGSDDALASLAKRAARVIDLDGDLVTPGLIDSHVHFLDGGEYLRNVALRDAASMREVLDRVARFAQLHPRGDWIQGEGFSYGYADLPRGEFHKELLDPVSGKHPVFLDSGMAHAAWVNSEALRRAGITRDSKDPPGGQIVRGTDGEPTGWLKEDAAIKLVLDKIPRATASERVEALTAAIQEANRVGLTRVDSAGGDFEMLGELARLERRGTLTLRISISDWINAPGLTAEHLAALEAARTHYHGALLSCCVAKFIMDGVLESHTAYMPGGYADNPAEVGMRFFEPARYRADVKRLNEQGFQVYTHAIGDGAIKLALDAYAETAALHPRDRIEHAEAPDAADIPRFGQLGVIASMQPLMIYPRDEWRGMEGLWQRYAGEQFLPRAFALRSLLDSGAVVAFGTDWPIVQLNPLYGIRNAVLRQSQDGEPAGGYVPEQRISVAEALRAYTLDAAYASRAERREGSIEIGKFADLVRFSKNFLVGPANDIPAARVRMTMLGGKVVYRDTGT
jgi:predicted amidohydrolase YtcJ